MSEERCPLCGSTGREAVDERKITQNYAEVAANAVKQVEALRASVAELEEQVEEWKRCHARWQNTIRPVAAAPWKPGRADGEACVFIRESELDDIRRALGMEAAPDRLAETEQAQWDRVHWGGEEP